MAGSLAAAKLNIPVSHVEAGLRSFNREMPEEINRVLTDQLSTLLLAPTEGARDLLLREGISADAIEVVGDIMHDAFLRFKPRAQLDFSLPQISSWRPSIVKRIQ